MNGRSSRTLALLAVLAVGASTARAADLGPQLSAANSRPAADKAAEAQRLAALAAQLAQQAAQLAAESQSATTTVSANKPVIAQSQAAHTDPAQAGWSAGKSNNQVAGTRLPQPVESITVSKGWRKHKNAEDIAIRFKGQEGPAEDVQALPIGSAPASLQTMDDLGTTESATRTLSIAPPQSEINAATIGAFGALGQSNLLSDAQVQPAARMLQDDNLIPEAEPVPPAPNYSDNGEMSIRKNGNTNGEEPLPAGNMGEYCGDACCCPPQRVLFWTAGVEATFLAPDLNTSTAEFGVIEFDPSGGVGRDTFFDTSTNDVDDLYMAPRLWIGVQGCKWGANLRYFHLRASEGGFDPFFGNDGEWDGPDCGVPNFGYNACNDLEAYCVDFEVTRRVCLHDCAMQFSLGVRHAEFDQNQSISGAALADDSTVFGFASSHRSTRGTGIVLGWYGRRPIFPCSCVNWFYNARFSPVWGPTQTLSNSGVELDVTAQGVTGSAGSVNEASTYVDDTMFIGEIQVGLEWMYGLRCIPANAFFRTAVEYQRWDGGRGASGASSFAGAEINGDPTTFAGAGAFTEEPQMDLLGFTIGTGLTW